MKLITVVLLLFFLVACAEELPPSPPAPGEQQLAGKAIGGIPISSGSLPRWAAEIKYTDIDPVQVKSGDTVKVTVTKPAAVKTKFYVHAIAYAYNKKFKFWEKAFADTSKSGNIVKTWAENKATFNVPISTDRFTPGPNYVVIYWCIDTETRDDKGFKIWDCQGKKWQLGAFEMVGTQYPDILIERDIENNRYKSSVKADLPAGTAYTANYESLTNIKTDVSVLQTKNVDDFKKEMVKSIVELEPKWTKRGNVCGFLLSAAAGQVTFGWLSGTNWLTVKTYANTIDDAKVGVYGIKYPSDCDLLNKLKLLVAPSVQCGNSVLNAGEECDKESDAACPGVCKPDCKCGIKGPVNTGTCGDELIQKPNAAGVTEDCEPPGIRDPVTGQLISTACFVRNAAGQITNAGACDDKCKCIVSPFTQAECGNGRADIGEQCGDPSTPGCIAGLDCVSCTCINLTINIANLTNITNLTNSTNITNISCSDSDGGWNLTEKGNATDGELVCSDRCSTSQEFEESNGIKQLLECFCDDKQAIGSNVSSNWTSCGQNSGCINGACSSAILGPSIDAIVVSGTSGCIANTVTNCTSFVNSTGQMQKCSSCQGGCCETYSCTASGELIEAHSPAGCSIPIPTCTDTDGGKSYTVKGSVRYTNNPYGVGEEFDICDVGNTLIERVCNSQTEYTQNWERYTCPGSCSNGACVGAAALQESTSSRVIQGTSGCNPNSSPGCVAYYVDFNLRLACGQCSEGCCVSYSCGGVNQLMETTNPANCNAGTALAGLATLNEDVQDVAPFKGIQIALFLIAAMGILVVTLLNFVHRE
jgi:hypothetical protein